MWLARGSPQWGSIIESLDAARLVEKLLETLCESKLLTLTDPEVELSLVARRGKNGGICVEALLAVRLRDDGEAGLEPMALRSLSDRLEMIGLDVAGIRGGEGFVEFVLRVEKRGDC